MKEIWKASTGSHSFLRMDWKNSHFSSWHSMIKMNVIPFRQVIESALHFQTFIKSTILKLQSWNFYRLNMIQKSFERSHSFFNSIKNSMSYSICKFGTFFLRHCYLRHEALFYGSKGLFPVSFLSTKVRPFSNGHARKARTFGVARNNPI